MAGRLFRSFVAAGLVAGLAAARQLAQEFGVGERTRKHREVLRASEFLLFLGHRRGAVGQGDDVVALLIGSAHRRLDAAIGQEATQDNVGDAALTQDPIQVGGFERT